MNYDTFLRFIFPDGMFDYFEMTQFNKLTNKVEIYSEEKIVLLRNIETTNRKAKDSMKKSI
jgi:hypothetical protein